MDPANRCSAITRPGGRVDVQAVIDAERQRAVLNAGIRPDPPLPMMIDMDDPAHVGASWLTPASPAGEGQEGAIAALCDTLIRRRVLSAAV